MRKCRYLVYAILFSLVLIIISTACISDPNPRMFNSRYTYEITIRHNGPLSNATFIIPLPVKDNSSKLATEIYSNPDFGSRDNVKVSLTRFPAGFDKSNISPFPGYDPVFLIITTQDLVSGASSDSIYNFKKDIHISLDTPNFPVNTLTPIGNETLVAPKFNFSWQNPQMTEKKSLSRIEYSHQPLTYMTKVYADFNAPESTYVDIYCHVQGSNYWIEGYDASVGNSYDDGYSKIFYGETHGWYEAEGKFSIADGVYPNPDALEWQKVLDGTTR